MTTTTMNFQIENLKAEIESTKKIQLADAVEEFEAKLAADCNLDDLTVAARHIAHCLNLIADYESRIDTLKAKISTGENPEIKKFEVGGVYSLDGGFADRFKVVAVNGSFVTVINAYGNKIRRKVRVFYNAETLVPYTERKRYGLRAGCVLSAKSFIKKITLDDETNAKLIACIDDYVVDAYAAAEVEIENAKNAAEVEEVNAENAKAAEKVAFFENLKETHDGKIFTDDVLEAWNLATCTLGKLKKNNTKTTNAGYTIFENSVGDWVSVLDDRFEVNLTTGQTFNVWTDSAAIENAKNYAWDEVEEGIFHAKNADEKTFWLNVCKAKFVNSLITLGVKDLIAAEIIREEELIACIDDYFVNSDDAAEVEEVNARNAVFEISKKRNAFIANVFANCGKFSIKLARSDEDRNFHLDEDGLWTVRLTEKDVGYLNELYYYEEGGKFTLALMRGLTDYNLAEYDTEEEVRKAIISLGAAVKRGEKIFTFPAARKPIIDWDAVYEDFRVEEIFNLQRDFKKFLKLGEMKRAETVFENLKDVFQKYQRRKAA